MSAGGKSKTIARKWTGSELRVLRSTLHLHSAIVAKRLHRTKAAVNLKRASLGLDSKRPPKWSREIVRLEICKRYKASKPLTAGYMNTNVKALFRAGVRVFGTWPKAVNAAGIDYEGEIRTFDYWNRAKIVRAIRKLNRSRADLGSHAVQKSNRALYQAACKHIGSWGKAMLAAGVSYKDHLKIKQPKPISTNEIVTQIRKWHHAREPLNANHVMQRYPNFEAQARRKFGSWKKAIEAAGFNYAEIRLESDISMKNGRQLETILERFFAKYYPHYEVRPRLRKDGRRCLIPDFLDRDNNVWIDCKLACWSIGTKETILKYGKYASEIHIYYLFGSTPRRVSGVKYFNIERVFKKRAAKEFLLALKEIRKNRP